MDKCKCCALNEVEFPKVLCRNEPYGDEIEPIKSCKDYISEEDQETFLSYFYKKVDEKYWRSLTYLEQQALSEKLYAEVLF